MLSFNEIQFPEKAWRFILLRMLLIGLSCSPGYTVIVLTLLMDIPKRKYAANSLRKIERWNEFSSSCLSMGMLVIVKRILLYDHIMKHVVKQPVLPC